MDLVHSITLINNFTISATQILGLDNAIADSLSRFQVDRFWALAPTASLTPCVVPPSAMLVGKPLYNNTSMPLLPPPQGAPTRQVKNIF